MAVKFTSFDLDNIVSKYLSGCSARKIAGEFGVSHPCIANALVSRGVTVRAKAEQLAIGALSTHSEEISKLYASGVHPNEIAKQFNCTNASVYAVLKRAGSPLHKGANIPPDQIVISEYQSGKTAREIAARYGIGKTSVHRILNRNGIEANDYAPIVDMEKAVELFESGIGLEGIYRKLGSGSRTYLKKLFEKAGIQPRNRSEQQFSRMANTTPEQRKQLTKAANDAMRGSTRPFSERVKRASARSRVVSGYELQLMDMLTKRGIITDPQFPIGPYNCDLASGSVAVEVYGGGFHWFGQHLASVEKRFRYILNAGWNILVVPVNIYGCKLDSVVADYVAAYIQESSRNPSSRREYRVVWRGGECFTTGSLEDNHISIKPPFTNRKNPTNGRYETIPR